MSAPRVGLLVFAAGLPNWRAAGRRLLDQARASARFRNAVLVTDKSLSADHPAFVHEHRGILRSGVRGFGYWIWKPYLIGQVMRTWQDEVDCILYLDAGSEINVLPSAQRRWHDYITMAMDGPGRFAMSLPGLPEEHWSKVDTMNALGLDAAQRSSDQIQATPLFQTSDMNIEFADDWLAACTVDGYHLVDDSPSVAPNAPGFREHRHDQAIFSALMKQRGGTLIPDETYWPSAWTEAGRDFPIWAPRNRTRMSVTDRRPIARAVTIAEKSYSRAYMEMHARVRRRRSQG